MRALVAFGASLLLAAWLYIHPPHDPPPSPVLPDPPALHGDPSWDWAEEYFYQQRLARYERRKAQWLKAQEFSGSPYQVGAQGSFWPHLDAEGNTSDI